MFNFIISREREKKKSCLWMIEQKNNNKKKNYANIHAFVIKIKNFAF